MQPMKRLPATELYVMLILWHTDHAVTSSYVMNQLKECWQKELAITSVITLLTRLSDKGFVKINKEGKANLYSALVSEENYSKLESKSILEKFYGNSLTSLVSSLLKDNSISKQDIEELRAFLNDLQQGGS